MANLLSGAVAVAFVVELTQFAVAPTNAPGGPLTATMVVAILLLPVLFFFLCAAEQPGRRLGWLLIGTGLAFNSTGEAWFYFGQLTLSDFPTAGD